MSEFEYEPNNEPISHDIPPVEVQGAAEPVQEPVEAVVEAAEEAAAAAGEAASNEAPVFDAPEPEIPGSESPVSDYPPVSEAYRTETLHRPETQQQAEAPGQAWAPQQTVRPDQTWRAPQTQPAETKKVRAKKSGGFGRKAVALALVCALLGGLTGAGGAWLVTRGSGSASGRTSTVQTAAPRETSAIQTVQVENGQLMTADQVYEKNVNSTVGITTEITTTNFWGYQSTAAAAGSGFILTDDGYILTNKHVIEKANSITVAMYDGTTYPATLVGYDASNDIAVLKIDAKDLTPVVLGDSDALKVGQDVIAIGNPLGELTFSLTRGAVSALNRAVSLSNATMNLIQTDCAINSGNSGGPLFNMYGEVIGITNAKYSSNGYSGEASIDNIGFAIPINSVRDIVTSIIEKGYISRPYIGVSISNVSEESQSYGLPQGAAIRGVDAEGPAAKAGLKENDIITAVNGTPVSTFVELGNIVSECKVGDELELTVYRQNQTLTITVTVGEKTQDALPKNNDQDQGQGQNPWGGSDPFGGMFPWGWGFGG